MLAMRLLNEFQLGPLGLCVRFMVCVSIDGCVSHWRHLAEKTVSVRLSIKWSNYGEIVMRVLANGFNSQYVHAPGYVRVVCIPFVRQVTDIEFARQYCPVRCPEIHYVLALGYVNSHSYMAHCIIAEQNEQNSRGIRGIWEVRSSC